MYHTGFSPLPLRINAALTDRCNFSCPTCSKWGQKPSKEMTAGEWKNIFKKLKGKALTHRATLTGGEPLLRHDILDIISYAKNSGFYISLITNGSLLNEKKLKALEKAGVDNLVVSLNGSAARTHDPTRGVKGSFDHIVSILPKFQHFNIKTNIETIIMGTNIDELEILAEWAKERRLHGIVYQALADRRVHYSFQNKKMADIPPDWRESDPFWAKDPERIAGAIEALIQKQKQGYPILNAKNQLKKMIEYYRDPAAVKKMICLGGVSNLFITPSGRMRLCHGLEPIGDIKKDPPARTWFLKAGKIRKQAKTCENMCRLLNNYM